MNKETIDKINSEDFQSYLETIDNKDDYTDLFKIITYSLCFVEIYLNRVLKTLEYYDCNKTNLNKSIELVKSVLDIIPKKGIDYEHKCERNGEQSKSL